MLQAEIDRDAIRPKRSNEDTVLAVSLRKYTFELVYRTMIATMDELRKHFGIVCSLRQDYENLLICSPKDTWKQFNQHQVIGYAQGYSAHFIHTNLAQHSFLPEDEASGRKPIPDFGSHMTLKKFREYCKEGLFTSDDGHGYYADKKWMSDVDADPEAVRTSMANPIEVPGYDERFPKGFTHVVWFNK